MGAIYAVVVGALFAVAIYLLMQRELIRLLLGLAVLGNAANLLIFVSSGAYRAAPPLIAEGQKTMNPVGVADPMPQALILTAIVIGFGVLAFAMALVNRTHLGADASDTGELPPEEEH
ncbi:MAG: NADH-quinone oxidoreductase subunit K [Fimbriimonadaceae bacterium]|nr:NADH-quinone oxidoreductase subunit K [Fimbriimonadaceae bacterium]